MNLTGLTRSQGWCVILSALAVILTGLPPQTQAQWDPGDWKPDFDFVRSPTVSIYYGLPSSFHAGITQPFADPGMAEIRLGGTRFRMADDDASILRYNYEYVTGANISTRLRRSPPAGEISTDLWRFGIGFERGLGYASDPHAGLGLVLYNAGGLNWTSFSIRDGLSNPADREILTRYEGSLRFGNSTEAGVKIRLTEIILLDAAFERSVVFRRTLFAKWAGSALLEVVAQGALDGFIRKILHSTPDAAPIVGFLLKNGLSYGFYQLKKDEMFWPFSSEAPHLNDTFKIGISFVF